MPEPTLNPAPPAVAQRKILVVDDVQSVRYYHSYILKKAGYQSEVAHDGRGAFQKLQQNTFDLVVVDILMPNVNGLELIEQIRTTPSLAKLPILVISSEPVGDKVRKERTASSGPVGFAKKPLLPDSFFEEIHRLLAAR
jgi:CheY-like chemotaxis protein